MSNNELVDVQEWGRPAGFQHVVVEGAREARGRAAAVRTPRKARSLTEENFAKLLAWLDPVPERAAEQYENIRHRLIQILLVRGCIAADELADEIIDRVSYRVDELADNYVGDRRLYFYGVARNVHREYLQKRRPCPPLVLMSTGGAEEVELKHGCLERCLRNLSEDDRNLILEYYRDEKQDKIERRKSLAPGVRPDTLRKKTQRIRERLKHCINQCMKAEEWPRQGF